jgi:hypothetical protein
MNSELLAPIKGRLIAVILLSVLTAIATIIPLAGIVYIAKIFPDGNHQHIWTIVAVIIIAAIIRMVANGMSGMLSHSADNDLQLALRRQLVGHIRRLPLGWLDSHRSAGIIGSVEKDVADVHQLIGHTINEVIVALLVPLFSLILLFTIDWRIALVALIPMIIIIVLMGIMLSTGQTLQKEYGDANQAMTSAVIEFVRGIAVMKSFGNTHAGSSRYTDRVNGFVDAWSRWSQQSTNYLGLIDVIASPVTVLLFMCNIGLAWRTHDVPLGLIAGLALGLGLSATIVRVAMNSESIATGIAALTSIAHVLHTPTIPEPKKPQHPGIGPLVADNITFSYDDSTPALSNVTARFDPGTITALVGPSGSGKSTLAKLLARFYDVAEGTISIAGVDVRDIATDELYRTIGMVFQDPQLLNVSIRENIRMCRPDATDDQIMAAARRARIDTDITQLPCGLDSIIGVDTNLSGGQEQRIAIARAFLADTPILILDEATAYADPDSEAAIKAAIDELAQHRTVIMIAHRLSTIIAADQILVLESGRIVERGTHQELLEQGELYPELWHTFAGAEAQ